MELGAKIMGRKTENIPLGERKRNSRERFTKEIRCNKGTSYQIRKGKAFKRKFT